MKSLLCRTQQSPSAPHAAGGHEMPARAADERSTTPIALTQNEIGTERVNSLSIQLGGN